LHKYHASYGINSFMTQNEKVQYTDWVFFCFCYFKGIVSRKFDVLLLMPLD
jgi:hypothetical protein